MKITCEYFRLYTKMMLSNKIAFVWYLLFPLIAFFIFNYNWFTVGPNLNEFYIQTSVFISYIIFVMSIDVSTSLISLRESGFFKMFKFISGSKYPIIWGKALNQIVFLLLTILLFSLVSGLIFLSSVQQIALFILVSLTSCLLGSVMVILLTLVLMLIPVRQESLSAVISMSLLVMFFLSAKGLAYSTDYGFILVFLNPMEYVRNLTFLLAEWFTNMPYPHLDITNMVVITLFYMICGVIALRFIKVVSRTHRT
ncbi:MULTISPECIES: hypothetical protein [Paenibacillus]|uniref:hypothetical protein n=1 Tax=Paenibacillus TaxID=44249 RepID=UPI0015C6729E|nr:MULTISPECIES: hypothetical protein [Paenibacillus]